MAQFPTYGASPSGVSGVQFPTYGSTTQQDPLSTPEGLYNLALQQGGAVAMAATELYHPQVGLMSSIGGALKNSFHKFINIISVPNQVVAGIISPDLTVGDTIRDNISASDVIYGEKDPNASIYQKIGSFLVRTATDVLLDPLTYVTFGASEGILGLTKGTELALGEGAALTVGKEVATLNSEGQAIYSYLTNLADQMTGSTAAKIIKTGNPAFDLAGEELKAVMMATIDSPLSPDYAKKALSNLIEKNPAYVAELLDKGGVKFFGKTILSGQRISSTLQLIPGMTLLDNITQQPRLAIGALFDPTIIKGLDNKYVRLPQEYVDMQQKWADFSRTFGEGKIQALDDIRKQFDLSETEARFLTASIEYRRIPTDPKLAQAFKATLGFNDQEWNDLVKAGLLSNVARLEGHVPHILVKNSVGSIPFRMPPSIATGANQLRKVAAYVDEKTGQRIVGHADELGLKVSPEDNNLFTDSLGNTFKREVEPIHKISEKEFDELEGTLLKNQKAAAAMLDDMRQAGFSGFDDNAITALAARSLKNTKAIGMKYFLKDLAENFGADAAVASAGMKRINSTALNKTAEEIMQIFGKEGELLFHPAIAAHVEKFMGSMLNDDATMDFLKAYDNLQNAWKATVTSIWPAFHGRNAISNVLNNFLDIGLHAVNPKIHTLSVSLINADRKINKLQREALGAGADAEKARAELGRVMQGEVFTDATGHKWTYGELRQVAKNNNIAFTNRIVTSADVQKGQEQLVKSLFPSKTIVGKAANVAKFPFKVGQDVVGKNIEEHARLVNFIANLRGTGDVTLAARRTKQFLFDYNNLTNFERTFLKRLIPFYTFTRKNLELQVKALMHTPGRIAAEAHAVDTLGEVISGGTNLTEEERKALPDWIKTGIGILTKKNGDQITMISNLGTPLEAPFQQLQANAILGSVSPLIRLPVEQLAGYSFYQGKPLSEVTNAAAFKHAPKVVQDLIGFTELKGKKSDGTPYTWYVSLHPEMMNLILNLPPTTRVFTALKQMDAVDVDQQAKIFQQLTGVKPYSFDLERERAKREKEMTDKLQKLLTDAGVTAQFKRTFIPKDKKNQLIIQ